MIRTAIVIALVAAAIPATLQAQDRWENQVRGQMARVAARAASRGYSMTPQYYYGRLRDGRSEVLNLNLSASQEYVIVAACDADCSDVDLALYESDGRVVTSDLRSDDLPVIEVPSGHGGTHPVKISMANCVSNPCRYEIAVFTR